MRQISASELREIAIDIENELIRLRQLESQMILVQSQMAKNPELAAIFSESLALKLHNFYTGCERIFQIIASELNGGLPSGYDWHRRLLTRMTTSQDYRPAILTAQTAQQLAEYLSFRHVVRNIYGFELETQRVENLVNNYYETWQHFEQDMQNFLTWLRTMADNLK
ncbi:hypothetical protein [Aphanothece sacrum]|uniref:HepT-like domain-containing protein n=1 Tax=Aphanothece sacrum FPU1 TaxID=1920663 RepID=A0A401IDC9_APHSA|nr:hypothetical protein [Aphanothece sacrum]GBF79199.1 hypothetical protein AsFPU1_0591 [Aphanothece sacrum FPU1]GBF86589.1 hypothetical protein AsFPU3_3660 [Aphanothece sacrum FPU3]